MHQPLPPESATLASLLKPSPGRKVVLLLLCLLAPVICGCVHRRMTIHSDPPGAQVLVDGEPYGHTPTSTDFTYYATREITLVKDGYETLTVMQKLPTPWYQIFPLDFFSEHLLPFPVTNRQSFAYQLRPSVVVPTQELLNRAKTSRSNALIGP